VQDFWGRVGQTLAKIDPVVVFDNVSKIFGVEKNVEIETLINLLIFAAQKSIFLTRLKIESQNKIVDLWLHYKRQVFFTMMNLRNMISKNDFETFFVKNRIVKISRYKICVGWWNVWLTGWGFSSTAPGGPGGCCRACLVNPVGDVTLPSPVGAGCLRVGILSFSCIFFRRLAPLFSHWGTRTWKKMTY